MTVSTIAGRPPVVAVVGGGLAGALAAVHLVRAARSPLRVVLVDREGGAGRGVAYATRDPRHRLNVPMERMSGLASAPEDFARWAAARSETPVSPGSYLPRGLYGDYVADLVREHGRPGRPATIERLRGDVVDVEPVAAGRPTTLVLASGARLACDAAILALGNLAAPPAPWLLDDPRVAPSPWAPGALEHAGAETTLIVGTGLTAVDAVLSLSAADPHGRFVAASGCGALPFAQLPGRRKAAPPPALPDGPLSLEAVMALVARHAAGAARAGFDWRDAVDGLRPRMAELWRRMPVEDRKRFVAERARAWELRRHRMAPEAAAEIGELRRTGRLRLVVGRVHALRATRRGVLAALGPTERRQTLAVDRVVVCAGPCTDVTRTPDRLVRRLLASGRACPDALRLGLAAGPGGELRDAAGRLHPDLRLIGPPLRGELWETTAVGEIRQQAQRLAAELCAPRAVVEPAVASA